MAEEGYRGPQVCSIVGISYRQLDYWARTNLIRPSVADARGSGTQRLYSYTDLVELKVIKSLLDAGVSLQQARRSIEYLRSNLGGDIGSARLVLNGPGSVLVHSDGELVDLLRKGQGVFSVVALSDVKEELDAAIHELRPPAPGQAGTPGEAGQAGTAGEDGKAGTPEGDGPAAVSQAGGG